MLRPDHNADDYARFYDEIGAAQLEETYIERNWYAVARFHLVLEWLLPVARGGGRLLDIGCASGYYSVAFARAGGTATGIDIANASVMLARRRAEREGVAHRCRFIAGDMRSLAPGGGEYDVVSMVEVLEHVREQEIAVANAVRVLRPGGILVVATPHAFDSLPRWKRFRYRKAATPESVGVDVERLGVNELVTDSGIAHEPYFHDAFTFEQLRTLVPEDAEILRLHSLYMPVPGLRLAGRLPPKLRGRFKRMLGSSAAQPPPAKREPANPLTASEPLPFPELSAEPAMMVGLSKLMWRIPLLRMTYSHHLLVARRRNS